MYAFPWGRTGTALADESGPEPWQRTVLQKLGEALHRRDETSDEAVRQAVASGHGDGDALALTFAYPVERRNDQQESCIQQKLAVLERRIV
jgi:hypothetical protein